MITFDKILRHLMNEVFPGIEPVRFIYGRALGPLRTELLGLRRNHARDEISLNEQRAEWYAGRTFFEAPNWPWPKTPFNALELKQERRERRMREILAKLARDGRMKSPNTGA